MTTDTTTATQPATFAGDPDPGLTNRAMRTWDRECHGLANEAEDAIRLTMEGAIPHDSMLALSIDDLENLYEEPSDWTYAQCREWLDENGGDMPDDDDEIQYWRDAVRDADTGAEVLQWFRVSEWMARLLAEEGEVVAEWGNAHIWGRQCFGQSVMLDGILQRVQRRIEA